MKPSSMIRIKLDLLHLRAMVNKPCVQALDDGWITLNGGSGEDEHGGSRVFIGAGGKIEKGAGALVGKKLSDLGGTKKFTTHETNAEREKAKENDKNDLTPKQNRNIIS